MIVRPYYTRYINVTKCTSLYETVHDNYAVYCTFSSSHVVVICLDCRESPAFLHVYKTEVKNGEVVQIGCIKVTHLLISRFDKFLITTQCISQTLRHISGTKQSVGVV